jgi:F-type H+-transporting ATPase subunit alpha
MKSIAGTLRLSLAQYREMAAFAQFGSDLDKATQAQLSRGRRLTEILKQGQYAPLPIEKQVILIYAGSKGYLDNVEVSDCGKFETDLYQYMDLNHKDILAGIVEKGKLDDELEEKLVAAIKAFKEQFVAA